MAQEHNPDSSITETADPPLHIPVVYAYPTRTDNTHNIMDRQQHHTLYAILLTFLHCAEASKARNSVMTLIVTPYLLIMIYCMYDLSMTSLVK